MEDDKAPFADHEDDEDISDEIIYIVNQAQDIFKQKNRQIGDTHFYKVVLAGNVHIISQVIAYLEEHDLRDVSSWLLQHASSKRKHMTRGFKTFKQCLTFGALFICVLITTPVFYLLHYLSNACFNQREKRISNHIELPLVYAAFSQKKAMISYFMSRGVKLNDCDSKGNNLFHYIADLSSVSSEKAVDIFDIVIKQVLNLAEGRKLLQEWKNTSGLTAIEYTAKYGSPSLLTHILNYPHLINITEFEANESSFSYGNKKKGIKESTNGKTTLKKVDVTTYELGSIRNQSKLLRLLSDRNVLEMKISDLKIFDKTALVGKWIRLKVKQMFSGILVFQLFDVLFTVLLLVIVTSKFTDRFDYGFKDLMRYKVQVEEMESLSMGKSMLFKPERYDSVFSLACANKQNELLHKYVLEYNETLTAILINEASRRHPDDGKHIAQVLSDLNFPVLDVTYKVMSQILDTAMDMPELQHYFATLDVYSSLPSLLKNITITIVTNFPMIAPKLDGKYFEAYDRQIKKMFAYLNSTYDNTTVELGSIMNIFDIFDLVCIKKTYFTQDDIMISQPMLDVPDDPYLDICTLQTLMSLVFEKCRYTSVHDTFNDDNHEEKSNKLSIVFITLCFGGMLYCLIDFLERVVFVYTCVVNQRHVAEMLIMFFSSKVPGSYARKQINSLTYGVLAAVFFTLLFLEQDIVSTAVSHFQIGNIIKSTIAINLIFRMVMHIHAMRLLPGIGHFVITTFMMGSNLINFSVVFGIAMMIFAVMFELLIYNPECPYENAEGFATLFESLFSTFRLTFGHGDLDPFFTNTPAMLTYALYMIVVGLMALNLIIAIMSTTAMTVMNEPWKQRLWEIEWLDEAISVEYTFCVLGMACRSCCHRRITILQKCGYLVKQQNGNQCVFIELFHSAALESLK